MTKTSDAVRAAADRVASRDADALSCAVCHALEDACGYDRGFFCGDGGCDAAAEALLDVADRTCEMDGSPEAWVTCRACGTALVQPGYATFEGGHVVLRDLAYCPACGARVIGRCDG